MGRDEERPEINHKMHLFNNSLYKITSERSLLPPHRLAHRAAAAPHGLTASYEPRLGHGTTVKSMVFTILKYLNLRS